MVQEDAGKVNNLDEMAAESSGLCRRTPLSADRSLIQYLGTLYREPVWDSHDPPSPSPFPLPSLCLLVFRVQQQSYGSDLYLRPRPVSGTKSSLIMLQMGRVSVVLRGGMGEQGQGARRVSAYREYW